MRSSYLRLTVSNSLISGWLFGQHSCNHFAAASGNSGQGSGCFHQLMLAVDSLQGRSRFSFFPWSRTCQTHLGSLHKNSSQKDQYK